MVRSLIRRVLGRQDVGVSNSTLELPPATPEIGLGQW